MTSSQLLADSISRSQRRQSGFGRGKRDLERSQQSQIFRRWFSNVLIVGIFLVLLAAIFRVQIFEGAYFRDLANGNRVAQTDLPPPRGIIYDRNGTALVVNLPAFRFRECQSADQKKCVARTISKEQAINLEVAGLKKGQTMAIDSVRSYPFGESTAHLLGYVSEVGAEEIKSNSNFWLGDKTGRGGIEQKYDSELQGKHGKELIEIDALGKKLRSLSTVQPTAGDGVNLTIDLSLQKVAFEALSGRKGAAVATNPINGEVLAIVSSPSFDPNLFTDVGISSDERTQKLNEIFADQTQPLFDRAIAGTYPAGSTFKIVTAAAGLESGKISESYTIDDPGILIVGPYRFPNWKFLQNGGTQGVLNVVSALKVSNDIFFYRVGEMLGVDGLSDFAVKFGLTKKTGIDLPGESAGSFPTKAWREKFLRSWYLGDTYHLAIGQGDMLATPIQTNRWTNVIANGGKLCRPHLVKQITDSRQQTEECADMGLQKKTLDLVKEGMIEACSQGGTAYPLFNFSVKADSSQQIADSKKIQIACKTGTAEFGEGVDRTHAWLTAFAPADNPTISVTVILEGAGEGADEASPVVKKMLEEWFGR